MEFPATGAFGTGLASDLTAAEAATLHNNVLAAARELPGSLATADVTISTGTITPSSWLCAVDTESAAASDDLVKIDPSNMADGRLLLLTPKSTARVVTVKTQAVGVGKIVLDGEVDFVMNAAHKRLLLYRDGNVWREILRVNFLPTGEPHGRQIFTSSGTFTVPDGVDNVWVTLMGGGGGGGGGAGTNNDNPNTAGNGGNGGNGGTTSFGAYQSAGGGAGGAGGNKNGNGGSGSAGLSLSGGRAYAVNGGTYLGIGALPLASPTEGTAGCGGPGGNGGGGNVTGGGGGASGARGTYVSRYPVSGLTPGQTITVTIGTAGTAGSAGTGTTPGSAGSVGQTGICIVEW